MKTFQQIIFEVGEWSKRNFGEQVSKHNGEVLGARAPLFGMFEELGELMHCHLKRHQGIRGFDNPVFFETKRRDAVADILVYAADFVARSGISLSEDGYSLSWVSTEEPECEGELDSLLLGTVGWFSLLDVVLGDENYPSEVEHSADLSSTFEEFLYDLRVYATHEKINLLEVLNEVWDTVQKRDWVNQPNGPQENG